ESLVRRQAAADAGSGDAGERPLDMGNPNDVRSAWRRQALVVAAVATLMVIGSAASAQDASTLKKDMIGQWELSTTERSKTCVVTLKGESSPQGLKLDLEPACAASLPFTKDISAWTVAGLDIVRLQNAGGQSVIDFTEVESGILEGRREG